MADLFAQDTPVIDADGYSKEARFTYIDWFDSTVRRLHDLPAAWQIFQWDASTPGGIVITGAIPTGTKKGRPTWRGVKGQRFIITREQVTATELAWQAETGKCAQCSGHGEEMCGWHHEKGHKYRPCKTCGGSGIAPSPAAGDPR